MQNQVNYKNCNLCQKEGGLSFCSKCRKVGYCSRECQVKDWKEHKWLCGKTEKTSPKLQTDEQKVIVKVLRKHFINIYRYIFAIDQKEADSFKDRNTHYYNQKHLKEESKPCKHNHSASSLANSDNKTQNGKCCSSFFAKIYIPEEQLSHLERAAKETLAKHKLPFVLPELLDYIGKKFFKLKEDGIKDGLKWDGQTQGYLAGECLKSGCQQFFINKIKEFSLKDQRVDSKQPLLLANAVTWKSNNPKVPLDFLKKERLSEFMTNGYTRINKYIEDDSILQSLHKELNFLEMDGRFDESVTEGSIRSDRNLWISLGEISKSDFPNLRKVAWQLSSIPYELSHKAQVCTQISELYQVSYFKGNGSYQKAHFDASFDGDQDNGRKVTCLFFCNLDNQIDCRNQGKVRIYTNTVDKTPQIENSLEFDTDNNSLIIFKSRIFPYEFLPNNAPNSKRFIIRFWVTGPIEQNKTF